MTLSSNTSNLITISVVVPARNEENSVGGLLRSLLSQSLPPTEIVITDSGSTDHTKQIINEFIRSGAPVRLIEEQFALPGRARNVAAKNATQPWLAFIDAGIVPAPDWLSQLAGKVAEDATAHVVYGTYEPVIDTFFKECAAIAYVPPPIKIGAEWVRPRSIASALMRREVWEKAGGFPEDLRSAEDLLFMRRVEELEFKTLHTSKAIVHWDIQPNFRGTFRRFVAYARNNIRAGLFSEWQSRVFIYYALIAGSALIFFALGSAALAIPFLLWLLFMASRSLKALYRNHSIYPAGAGRNLRRLALILPILTALDAATFVGSINWLLRDKLGWLKPSVTT